VSRLDLDDALERYEPVLDPNLAIKLAPDLAAASHNLHNAADAPLHRARE